MQRLMALAVLALSVAAPGCGDKRKPPANGESRDDRPAAPPSPSPGSAAAVSEDEARAKLAAALKSWSFGDTADQFEKANPGIQVFEPTWSIGRVSGVKLVRYDIQSGRASTETLAPAAVGAVEFLVALDFQNRPEGASITRTYKVQKNKDGSWAVIADRG